MGKFDNLAAASNEHRNQNIMLLRQGFNDEKYNTLEDAVNATGFTLKTVTSWAKDGNIPLLDNNGATVVTVTSENSRQINAKNRTKHINDLCAIYYDQQATTVSAYAAKMGYPESTVTNWARLGDVPLISSNGNPIVPLNDTNTPSWYDTEF
ncbi:hypothetical protein ABTQ33_03700 [Paucilactobacillus suebicus]|uniref:Uncharacterized protein n=1 Tax=Paucilactobacillus suebicus DSM 5007 = KCTC 3549 TaxID=1423807 RepID=A0A0R1WCK7_9LACO|nr:hypothetical protein [Paucilactobacillus suebicus]KRM13305.1 hypothetical protein FD16_GL000780 [Paucilactobacillus suebicus DSM 5007 = KCTC 3549]